MPPLLLFSDPIVSPILQNSKTWVWRLKAAKKIQNRLLPPSGTCFWLSASPRAFQPPHSFLRLFHHKSSVSPITDIQPAARDNAGQIRESRSVPSPETATEIRQNPILGSSLTTKPAKSPLSHWFSKILAISPLNSKILREFPAKSMILLDRGEGGYPQPRQSLPATQVVISERI
jgi:hypothetical protein